MKMRFGLVSVLAAAVALLVAPSPAHASQGSWPDDGIYIINFSSHKCIQPSGFEANAIIEQGPCAGLGWQRWRPTNVNAQGYVWLVNEYTGMCLDIAANSPEEIGNGVPLQQFWCSEEYTSERWNKVPGSRAGYSQIFSFAAQTSCMDLRGRSNSDDAVIQLWSCKFLETAQEFKVSFNTF